MARPRPSENTSNAENLAKEIIQLGQSKNFKELEKLIGKNDIPVLEKSMVRRIERADASILLNYLLIGIKTNSETSNNKRFAVIMAMLNEINKVEVTSKQLFDLVTRTFIELPKLKTSELIQLCEYCIDSIRLGDSKCTGWKELFPELVKLLSAMPKMLVQGDVRSGTEYCDTLIRHLLTVKWPETILTGIASMFLDIYTSKIDKISVLNKLCESIIKLDPEDVATLSFQLFSMCTTPTQLMIPLFALNQYFQKFYYQKLFDDMNVDSSELDSDLDRIDRFSDNDLLAAQNTILYHLSNCSEYKISEKEVVQQFKALSSNPKYILTPFLISSLLTISNISRYLESIRLSVSHVLPFIRTVIQNNEKERELCKSSAWFRDTLEYSAVDVNKLYTVLVDQSKEDIFTPGLVAMAFVLLKAAQYSSINIMGMHFLEEFIKKRYQLGNGIVRSLKEFLFADQDSPQYAESLARLSIANTMMVSECYTHIKEILDFFLLIPGQHAMRMMTIILPLIKNNAKIRDYFIDVLRRAMYQSNLSTRQMGVHGFCLILKQQRNNNAFRSSSTAARFNGSQLSISGFSVMSQQLLGSQNNPNMNFDMCVLEIIGVLRKCFNQTYEIKEILYDGLLNAVQQNPKLISHVLQFLDWHFRNYFDDLEKTSPSIKFSKCINETVVDEIPTIKLNDHLGKLLHFMGQCVILVEYHDLEVEIADLRELFDTLIEKCDKITMKHLGLIDLLTPLLSHVGQQFLNCLEGLMYYCLRLRTLDEENITTIMRIFNHHTECTNKLQEASNAAKKSSRKKTDDGDVSTQLKSLLAPRAFKPENIWDLAAVHSFLEAICREPYSTNLLREKTEFCVYILNATRAQIESMRTAPEYKQIKYSKSNFKYLTDISALLVKHYLYNLMELIDKSEVDVARTSIECFQECLTTITKLYQRKMLDYLKVLPMSSKHPHPNIVNINLIVDIQHIINELIQSFENNDVGPQTRIISLKLFQCLELLYDNIDLTDAQATEIHTWLHSFCKTYTIEDESASVIHKLYFMQCIRTQNGAIFEGIAKQIEQFSGQIEEETIGGSAQLKSINDVSAGVSAIQLCNAVKKQVEDVDYFILKVKGYYAQLKIGGQCERDQKDCEQQMALSERRICTQLIFILRVCIHLANTCLPLGQCMDNFLKLVTQYYICLGNLARHLITRQKFMGFSLKYTKFDQLVQSVGKKLPLRIYAIIRYIEESIDDETTTPSGALKKSTKNAKNDKAKVMRDTKFIPKLILRIEHFNKYVISLSKKTEHDLAKCLHMGTVRDFRIKTADLRQVLEKTLQDSEDINIDSDDEDDDNHLEEDIVDDDIDIVEHTETTESESTSSANPKSLSGETTSTGSTIRDLETTTSEARNVLKNLDAINKKANKRKNKEMNDGEENATTTKKKKSATSTTETARRSKRKATTDN